MHLEVLDKLSNQAIYFQVEIKPTEQISSSNASNSPQPEFSTHPHYISQQPPTSSISTIIIHDRSTRSSSSFTQPRCPLSQHGRYFSRKLHGRCLSTLSLSEYLRYPTQEWQIRCPNTVHNRYKFLHSNKFDATLSHALAFVNGVQ